jgi:enediyne polyketide synthase
VRTDRLFLLAGDDADRLAGRLTELRGRAAAATSVSELEGDRGEGELRAALVAAEPQELLGRIETLEGWLGEGMPDRLRAERGLALGRRREQPRIGFLFPGPGAPVSRDAGYLASLLPEAASVYDSVAALQGEEVPAELVQLSVVTASVAGLRALAELGIEAELGLGHSVGELTALHWAGALGQEAVLELARRRGEVMTEHASAQGAMANIEADEETFDRIVDAAEVTVACVNSPRHRVVSGATEAVDAVVERARAQDGAKVVRLRVVGAFHSPLMEESVPMFEQVLAEQEFDRPRKPVHSTVTGEPIAAGADLSELLVRQMTEPVLFLEAVRGAVDGVDLLLEVGPGRMLSGLVSEFSEVPALPLRVGHSSSQGLLTAVGAAHALGVPVNAELLGGD